MYVQETDDSKNVSTLLLSPEVPSTFHLAAYLVVIASFQGSTCAFSSIIPVDGKSLWYGRPLPR